MLPEACVELLERVCGIGSPETEEVMEKVRMMAAEGGGGIVSASGSLRSCLAALLHYGSISPIVKPRRTAHLRAMVVTKEVGALLSYGPNLRIPLWSSSETAWEQILSIWDRTDIVKISNVDLDFLTGDNNVEDDEVVLKLWKPGMEEVVSILEMMRSLI